MRVTSTCAPSIRWPSSASARPSRDATELGVLGERLFGSDLNLTLHVMEGAGAVRVRRGDGTDGLNRGQARDALAQAPVPGPERPLGQADGHQQRRDAGHDPANLNMGAPEFRKLGTPNSPGTKTFALDRPCRQHRPDRGSLRRDAARNRVQHRRRRHGRQRQGHRHRLSKRCRSAGLRAGASPRSTSTSPRLRFPARRGRDGPAPAASW